MNLSQSPLPLLHPRFCLGVNPVPYSSCWIISTLEERDGMPGKGGITASVDGQLMLSKREVDEQKITVTFFVASASAAFSLSQVWQNVTSGAGGNNRFASPSSETDKTRTPVCLSICWPFRNLWHLLHICEEMHWSHYQQTGKCAKSSIVSWAAAPFQVICALKSQEASWLCSSS